MVADQLYDPSEQHLPLAESIRRIAQAFRHVAIDRERGDAKIRERYDRMVAGDTPELILQSQRALFGQAAWVSISDDHEPIECFEFLLIDSLEVWIEYRSSAEKDRLRPSVMKLAELLEYHIASQ